MPVIALPKGQRGLKASPRQIDRVENMIYQGGDNPTLLFRPSVTGLANGVGTCRGSAVFRDTDTGDELLYMVSGDRLLRVTLVSGFIPDDLRPIDVGVEDIGEIPYSPGKPTNDIEFAGSFTHLVILVKGAAAYIYNGSTLDELTDVKYVPSNFVSYDAGRFIFIPSNGDVFFWTNTGDPYTIDAENFGDAEQFTDPNKACYVSKSSLYVFGTRSIEQLSYNPSINAYTRISGAASSVGYVGCLVTYGESFAFLGQGSDGSFNFYVMEQGPRPISNSSIAETINRDYSLFDLEKAQANFFIWKGIPVITFNLPGETFAFYGDWASWKTTGRDTWRINHIQYAYGYLWTGDDSTRNIGYLVDTGIDYDQENEWMLRTKLLFPPRSNALISRIHVSATVGLSSRGSRIGLSVSNNGYTFSPTTWQTLGKLGHYSHEITFGQPIMRVNDFCAIIVKGYGDSLTNIDGLSFV